jgi:hypothetical protein
MSKDPAFLFYDGDAARDVSHMNRLERGAYFDLIQAQRKFGGCTVEQIRKIFGKDFDEVWPAIELILYKTDLGIYFIEWVQISIENRKDYAEKQRKRIQDYWDKKKNEEDKKEEIIIPRNNHGITTVIPLVNENAIENENEIVVKKKGGTGGKRKTIFIPPELFEVEDYFFENGYTKDSANKFFKSYSVADWFDSRGNPVKNWKQKANMVWFKDDNKIRSNGTGTKQQFGNNSNSGVSDDYKRSILERLGVTGGSENMPGN